MADLLNQNTFEMNRLRGLKTPRQESHNRENADTLLREFVKFLARQMAEEDFKSLSAQDAQSTRPTPEHGKDL